MLKSAQVHYLVRESFSGFKRRKLTTGVTILIMGAALLILALLTIVTINLDNFLGKARQSIDIRVFLQDGLSAEVMAELQPRLLVIPGVSHVSYISSEMALEEFRTRLGDDADVLELLDNNPLPASFQINLAEGARSLDAVRAIEAEIIPWPEVADILFNQGWIDSLERWTFRFRMASLIVGLMVFISAVFVISNTVKLTVASSARVIEIQKLVGATNAFIRTPFLCEGMIQGFLAGVLAMGILASAGWLLSDRLEGVVFFSAAQIAGFILFCVVLGLTGSYAAMRKYLTLEGAL